MRRLKILSDLARLGASTKDKIKIVFFYFFLYSKLKIKYLPGLNTCISFNFFGNVKSIWIGDISDFWTIKSVFVDLEYGIQQVFSPEIIIDLGSNIGISVIYFALKYPHAQIYAYEPNPLILERLKMNVKEFQNVKVHNFAISDNNSEAPFYVSNYSTSSSLKGKGIVKEVKTITLDKILLDLNINSVDILKFDIEGSEQYIFNNFVGFKKVRYYVGEMHYDLMDLNPDDIREKLGGYTYEEYFSTPDKRSIIKISRI